MIQSYYYQKFPCLNVDEQFYLREQSLEDTEAFFSYYTDPDVGKHILATKPKTLSDAGAEIHYCRNLFYQRQGIYWTLARRDNNQMIGAIGLYINNHHHRAEICYDLDKNYWRKGIMTHALHTVIAHCFQSGIIRMEALTVKENIASIKILQKFGFIHEGTLRNYRYFENYPYDVEMFGLIPQEFPDSL